MASKNKEVKPISVPAAAIMLLAGIAAMATFITYLVKPELFSSGNEVSYGNNVVGQSFAEESEDEPPIVIGEEKDIITDTEVVLYVNDLINLGTYNGAQIQWQVIAVDDNRALVISRYCIAVDNVKM